jgi:dTDP-4-dehydrorhamnose reductase
MRINARGTANVRDSFLGPMILISTDYVFDGRAGPYRENDIPNPLNWYGQSKLASEAMTDPHKDIIVRTTNLYGNWDKPDFVQIILDKYKQGTDFFVTDKLIGNPTYIPHLAEALIFIANQMCQGINLPSVLNVAGEPRLSRYDCARRLGFIFLQDVTLCQSSPSGLVEDKAVRPKRAGLVLERAKRLGVPIYSFETGLFAMKEDTKNVNYK